MLRILLSLGLLIGFIAMSGATLPATAQEKEKAKEKAKAKAKTPPEWKAPQLPEGKTLLTETSPEFLKSAAKIADGVTIAKTAPTIDFAYVPGQTYAGNPWSNWGDSVVAKGKYYFSVGDHMAPGGNAYIYEYDPEKKTFRLLLDIRKVLNLPEGHYTPGKIHSRLDMGDDGWIYCSTHRGSTRTTTDANNYKGDWILRCNPETGKAEIVVHAPIEKHCIPTGMLDPKRQIFYASTHPGNNEADGIRFFAYSAKDKKILCDVSDGPTRAMILAQSTGRVYYVQGKGGALMRYDPVKGGEPVKIPGEIGLRAATLETPDNLVYTVSQPGKGEEAQMYSFNTKTEAIEKIGPASVGTQGYITSMDADSTGRFIYYIPGAHGGADRDGTPVVQYDTKNKSRKIIAFLHPHYQEKYGVALVGTYSSALSASGDTLFVTWNANRGVKAWDTCAFTAIHIPAEERK